MVRGERLGLLVGRAEQRLPEGLPDELERAGALGRARKQVPERIDEREEDVVATELAGVDVAGLR